MKLLIDTDDTLRFFTFTLNYRFAKLFMGEQGVAPESLVPLIDCPLPEGHIEHLKSDMSLVIPNLRISRDAAYTLLNVFEPDEHAMAFRGNLNTDGSFTRRIDDPLNSMFRVSISALDIPLGETINLSFFPNEEKMLQLFSDYKNYTELVTASPFMLHCGIRSQNIKIIYYFRRSWSHAEVYNEYNLLSQSLYPEPVFEINETKIIVVDDFFHLAQTRASLINN